MRFFDLFDLPEPLQVLDVGAAAIAEAPVYKPLLDRGAAHLHAVDGDARHADGLTQAYAPHVTVHPAILFDGTQRTVYLCDAASGMTSLFKPRPEALQFFTGFARFGTVLSEAQVQTTRLDDLPNMPCVDFIKMDVQGAELTVLRNGPQTLRECVAIQLEVSWICLYEDQPAFGEIDTWMRAQGFVPHRIVDIKRWAIAPTVFGGNFRVPGHQLLEADVVYVRDPTRLDALSDRQLQVFAVLAHHAFASTDLCVFLLRALVQRGALPRGSARHYLAATRAAA